MQDAMQTWQLSEEKEKLKVRAKTREVEATVLTVFVFFEQNLCSSFWCTVYNIFVLHTTFLSHSSKHAPRIQMPHALYFLHLTACTTSIPCAKWTCPSGRRPRRRRWPWPWLRTRWLQAHTKSDSLEAVNWT